MMGNGESLDLYKLFMVVKKKGGYDAVCKNRLWDLVGEEYGLGVKVGSDVEHVYSKHLSALETCLKNVAGGKFAEYGLEGDRVKFQKHLMEAHTESMLDYSGEEEVGDEHERRDCGCPDGRKLSGSNRVKCVKPESNGAEQESAYKYIDRSKSCGSNSVKDKNTNSNGNEYDNVCDYLEGRKLCGTNRVNGVNPDFNEAKKVRRPELVDLDMLEDHDKGEPIVVKFCGFNTEMDTPEEFDESKLLTVDASDAESDMLRLSDGSKNNNKDDDDESDEVLILDPSSVDQKKFGHKRKRESVSEMLIWINSIAKNPCDPAVGSVPEKSKWKSCSSQEIWKQALLFREAVFLKKDFETASEQLSWQSQKMHPSMYDDRVEALYNFRKRLKCEEKSLLGKSTFDGVSSTSSKTKTKARGDLERTSSSRSEDVVDKKLLDSCSLDKYARVHIPVGPNHQAEVPEWTGTTCESDSKWLGTQIWPPKFVNSKWCLIERDPIGKGRQDSCGCPVQGSVECVRFHVGEKRSKVKIELGEAFFQWRLDMVGEEVSSSWTDEDEKKFRDVVKSNPASLDKCFWDHLFKTFPKKSREDLVCYYFNVFLLQQRAYQNRHTPDNIDSDDDESEFTPLRKVFGHQTPKSRNLTLLSPKKSTGKRSNGK